MNEYISREEAIDKMRSLKSRFRAKNDWDSGYDTAIAEAFEHIKRVPVADVQPVKHGHWETWGYVFHGIEWERCSVCGKTADISYIALLEGRIESVTPSFCGCCGARMEQEE